MKVDILSVNNEWCEGEIKEIILNGNKPPKLLIELNV